MAVYKQDRIEWVTEAVNSILTQTFREFVLVVVIDGDINDDIKTFLIEAADQSNKMMLVEHRVNVGLSACMNFVIDWGIDHKPRYFFRMDADDISSASRLEKQISYLDVNPHISILGTALTEINELGVAVGKRKLPLNHGDIVKFLPKRCSINHPTVAIRFNVFEQGHRYREALRNTQDYFFWTDLAVANFKFANLGEKLLQFRRVNDFYKRRGLNKSLNEFKARFYAMRQLKRYSIGNIFYAFAVLLLRLMPSKLVKLAYKLDRFLLDKKVKHE
jgi:glycosyltransferase involved in cell wall biosynthesis